MPSLYDHFRVDASQEDHGAPLIFNQRLLGNIPFRGNAVPALRQEEMDELDMRAEARVRTFDLADPAQLKDYQEVLHRIVNGWYAKLFSHHHFDAEKKSMVVHLEWCQLYKETPPHLDSLIEEERRVG